VPDRLYLKTSTSETAGFSGGSLSSLLTPDVSGGLLQDMGPGFSTTTAQSPVINSLATTAPQHLYLGQFISPPLTGVTTIQANTWEIGFCSREASLNANMQVNILLFVMRSNGTVRGVIRDSTVATTAELGNSTPAPGLIDHLTGAAVTGVQPTDRLVMEVWAQTTGQSVATSYAIRPCNYGGDGSDPIVDGVGNLDPPSYLETPQSGLFAGSPPPPITASTLYFRSTQDNQDTHTTAEFSAAMTPLDRLTQVHDLQLQSNPTPTPSATPSQSMVGSANTSAFQTYLGKFISPVLAVSSIPAGTWEIGWAATEANANANRFLAVSVYVLKADDTVRGFVYDDPAHLGSEFNTGSATGKVAQFTGSSVSGVVATDRLAVEVWATTPGQAAAVGYRQNFWYDGGTDIVDGIVNGDPKTYIQAPVAGLVSTVTPYGPAGGATPSGGLTITPVGPYTTGGGATPSGTLSLATQPTLSTGTLVGEARPTGTLTASKISQPSAVDQTGGSGSRQPWLNFCGQEVMNAARTVEYIKRLQPKIDVLDDTHPVLYHTTGMEVVYEHPASDPAPWYDPADNRSAEFLGLLGTISDLSTPTTRNVSQLNRGGAQLGPPRLGPRTLTVRGFLVATTWAGQEYGREWLSEVLAGCAGCALCDTQVMLWAPTIDRLDSTDGRYSLYDTALTDGPKQLAVPNCPELLNVEFTITSEHGEWFSDPILRSGVEEIPDPGFPSGCMPFDDWFCSQPMTGVDAFILAPQLGTQSVIVQIDATGGGANGLEIGLYTDCSAQDEPLARIVVDQLPAGSYLTVDSSRRRVVVVDPDGVVRDGIGYLVPDPDFDIEWMQLDSCDTPACVIVRRLANCSETTNVRVAILTQLRVR